MIQRLSLSKGNLRAMSRLLLVLSCLFGCNTAFSKESASFSHTFSLPPLDNEVVVPDKHREDFELLAEYFPISSGSQCVEEKSAEVAKKSNIKNPMFVFMEIVAACQCSDSAIIGRDVLNKIIEKHPGWKNRVITYHETSTKSSTIDIRNYTDIAVNYHKACL